MPTRQKKIIHLSDLHVGYENLTSVLGDMVSRMIFHKRPASDYVVVVTGDLVDNATEESSYAATSEHLNRLEDAGFMVLVVPGNHDYGTGGRGYSKYVELFKQHFFGNPDITYPKLDMVDNIAFIGLDSTAEELNWYDSLWAQGELGEEQLDRLAELLASDELTDIEYKVVYLHHHPFAPKPLHHLKDSEKLGDILKNHPVDVLLFGHNHDGKVWNGNWGIERVYDAGSSTGKDGKANPHRVIDFSREPAFDYDAQF
ncbi:MAG: metallophosphoesterase [Victivallaceae bacterium]|nr:metallophosphoesterase [Victivallaceae bacterium]